MSVVGFAGSVPKTEAYRSLYLREQYRRLTCQWPGCGIDDGTVCCAHSNFHEHGGKGGARKADDSAAASLCHTHHSALDQGSRLNYEEKLAGWEAAHAATMQGLIELSQELGPRASKLRAELRKAGIVK